MSADGVRRRPGGPVLWMAVDLVRFTVATRSWGMAIILLVGLLAVAVGVAVQTAAPWAIYPFV